MRLAAFEQNSVMEYSVGMRMPERSEAGFRPTRYLRSLRRAVLFLVVGVVVVPSMAIAGSRSPYDGFPLAKDVPGGPYATLATAKLRNGTRWGVFASRLGSGALSRRNPCVSVARITKSGRYGNANRCGSPVPSTESSDPVYVGISGSGQNKPGGPVVGETVMGMSFSESVRRVQLKLTDGSTMTKYTRLLNDKQQVKTHLEGFRYIAIGVQRDVCVLSVAAFDANGVQVFSGATKVCPQF